MKLDIIYFLAETQIIFWNLKNGRVVWEKFIVVRGKGLSVLYSKDVNKLNLISSNSEQVVELNSETSMIRWPRSDVYNHHATFSSSHLRYPIKLNKKPLTTLRSIKTEYHSHRSIIEETIEQFSATPLRHYYLTKLNYLSIILLCSVVTLDTISFGLG